MTEVDLIPEDYRQTMRLRRFGKSFVIAFALVVLLVGLGKGMLTSLIAMEKSATATLESDRTTIVSQRAELEKLRARQVDLQERLATLDSLQGGPSAGIIFAVINRAVNQSVWFTGLKFRRTTEGLNQTAANNSAVSFGTGARDKDRAGNDRQSRMRMEISGQALNHSALADLVERLLDQEEIDDVHIINTSTLHYPAGQVVAYNLVVIINARAQRES
jgi:uncharacterized protein YoxC